MALPKLMHPTFELIIPSTKQKVRFRPFLVKEEKLLLMAKQSGEQQDVMSVVQQVIVNCDVDSVVDPTSLASFDLEYLFLQLRAKSVGETIDISYSDPEDEKTYNFKINVDDIKVVENPEHSKVIKLSDTSGIVMRYPSAGLMGDVLAREEVTDILFFMIRGCMEMYYDGDNIQYFKDSNTEEVDAFIEDLPTSVLKNFEKFFDTMPKLYHKINYTNEKGTEREVEFKSIEDFFTLG
jgi:T4 bacteriophage base plate protein